jgi:protein-tyrosine-phosphatase
MAEMLLRSALDREGRSDVEVRSAETGAHAGAPASEGAYLVALEAGLDLSSHRARQLTPELILHADLILTMSRSHQHVVEEMGGDGKSHLLTDYGESPDGAVEVSDPFGAGVEVYRDTFQQLDTLMVQVVARLERGEGP